MSMKVCVGFNNTTTTTTTTSNSATTTTTNSGSGEIVRAGYLRKLKRMHKRFFVLRAESGETPARLEYHDSEKKFRSGAQPKRSILLKACFNINQRHDTKHRHVIALYTKDDCFCVVLDNERDLEEWLTALLSLQRGDDVLDGEPPKPTFEHVWQVTMLNKGLGSTRNILGSYHLCFTDKTLRLVRKATNHHGGGHPDQVDISLSSVRRCGHSECFFYMEVGRSAATGAGELWMQTEDQHIAQNMGETILRAMLNNNNKEEVSGPRTRNRSSSVNESSKPISMQRRQTHSGTQKANFYCSPGQGSGGRERCDSMPTTRSRTSSEGNQAATAASTSSVGVGVTSIMRIHGRPQSVYGGAREVSHSPPAASPLSPPSGACSTDSAGSSLSIDEPDAWADYTETSGGGGTGSGGRYGHSLTPDEPIAEENCDEALYAGTSPASSPRPYVPMAPLSSDDGYVDMSPRTRLTDMSPAASMCSVTSGTPSTDIRFTEFHLEKVSSYLTPSEEDDTSSAERPLRTYSVGSRPETLKIHATCGFGLHDNPRERAFSVGSRSKGMHSRVLPPHGHPPTANGKSSSAPLLHGPSSSHSSMERMDDLMEMDFSRPVLQNVNSTGPYMDMSPRTRSVPPGYVEMRPGVPEVSSPARDHSPYMDMRPLTTTSPLKPPASAASVVATTVVSSAPYVDMRPSTSPHKPSTLTKYAPYMEMSGNTNHKLGTSPKGTTNKSTTNAAAAATSPIQEEYMDMEWGRGTRRTLGGAARTQPVDLPQPRRPTDGYMDMGWNRHQRKSSLDSAKVHDQSGASASTSSDDYINMEASVRKKERRGSKKDKTRSQPIQIQQGGGGGGGTGSNTSAPTGGTPSSHSPNNSFPSLLGRKNSSGTPPKHPPNFLPISSTGSYSPATSPFSSLRRTRSRKSSRRDSKDSSGLVTPTSESSTIFPFSPGSPIKPFQVKSPDTATTTRPLIPATSSAGDYARMSFEFANKVGPDYTQMSFEGKSPRSDGPVISAVSAGAPTAAPPPDGGEYVNYCPAAAPAPTCAPDDYGEYAIMKPGAGVLVQQMSTLNMNNVNMKPCVFRPIAEPRAISPRPGDVPPQFDADTSNSEYETLRGAASPVNKVVTASTTAAGASKRPGSVSSERSTGGSLSRPSSVSSELGSGSSTVVGSRPSSVTERPASVSSDHELHYASLDLATVDDEGTRSPRGPTPAATAEPTFTYAEIDFLKSEGLKQAVKH